NLVIKGGNSSVKTLDGNIDVDGKLTINSSTTLDADNSNNYNINLAGDWDNSGTFNEQAGKVVFDGGSAQTIQNSETFHDMELNNSSGLSLNGSVTLNGKFTLSDGVVTTTSSNLLTLNITTATDSITENSPAASDHIDGPVDVTTEITEIVTIPVGDGSSRNPVSLKPASTSSTTWSINYNNSEHSDNSIASGDPLDEVSAHEYWTISRSGSADLNKLRLYYDGNSSVDESTEKEGRLVVSHYNGSDWETAGNISDTAINNTDGGGTNGYIETSSTISSFSPFTLGTEDESNLGLPVKLLKFRAVANKDNVELNWITATEKNNSHFDILRSKN
ncbi:MAG: hypothetical protein ABEH43_00680, partial [Flavobacteriales bacterium]